MSIWGKIWPRRSEERATGIKTSTLREPADWLVRLFRGGSDNIAKELVNRDTARTVPAVLQAIRIRSFGKMMPTLQLKKEQSGGGTREITISEDERAFILGEQFNDQVIALLGRRAMYVSEDEAGNSFAFIDRARGGRVKGIYPIDWQRVEMVFSDQGVLNYRVYADTRRTGDPIFVPRDYMLHVPCGLTTNGLYGTSPLDEGENAISTMLAADKQAARYFSNNAKVSVALMHPNTLSDEAIRRLEKDFLEKYTGADNAFRPLFLEDNLKVEKLNMSSEEIELLESRRYSLGDVSRIYNVPPMFLFDYGRATWSNSEEMFRQFVMTCLLPELMITEKVYNHKFLTREERMKGYKFRHNLDALLRGDSETRWSTYQIARNIGVMNADEIRSLEGWNPREDGQGHIYLDPMNMASLNEQQDQNQDHPKQDPKQKDTNQDPSAQDNQDNQDNKKRMSRALAVQAEDKVNQILRKQASFLTTLSKKQGEKRGPVDEFFEKEAASLESAIQPIVMAASMLYEVDAREPYKAAEAWRAKFVARSKSEGQAAVESEAEVKALSSTWKAARVREEAAALVAAIEEMSK